MRIIPTPLKPVSGACLTALPLFMLLGCLDTGKPCCDYLSTNTVAKGLYVEHYRTYCAGVFGESRTSYLTDSVSFRQVIGGSDEHGNFEWQLNGNELKTFTTESSMVYDTLEVKTISKADLLKYHHSDTTCLTTTPLFGKNTIKCDTDFYPTGAYTTDDGNYRAHAQYKCGNEYLNAEFYTDSVRFCILLGIGEPGNTESYDVKLNTNNSYSFYRINGRRKMDSLNVTTYLLSDLKKGKLIQPCAKQRE